MIKQIDSLALKQKMENGEDFVLIDVREADEWDQGHIHGAIFIPLSNFAEACKKLNEKNADIVIQCRSGARSFRAAQYLESLGFTNLTNLQDGILGWAQNSFEIVQD
ncbi:MAG: rhodanese-like domain-containing protein [Bacteriovoracaceae bacterium]